MELQTEKVFSNKDLRLPYIGLEHIAQGAPRLLGTAESSSSVSVNSLFKRDDILFGKLRPNLKKSLRAPFNGYCSTDILVLRCHDGVVPAFAGHVFQWEHVFAAASATAAGTKMPRTSWSELRRLRVFAPKSGSEQSLIAAVLDTVDEAIAKTEAVIAKLKQVRSGLLHDLLTRGLDENGELRDPIAHPEQFQDSPLGWIPKAWDALPLERLAEVDRGKFGHRPRNDPAFYGGDFPFIQTGDVALAAGETICDASQRLNERGATVSKEFPLGTIAVTIAANIGDTAILGRPMYFPDSVVGVVTGQPHSARWIELALRRAKTRLNALAPQSAQRNINLEFLRPLLMPVPKPLEQQRCSALYESLACQIRIEFRVLEKLKSIKSGLAADLLTGRVSVPESILATEAQQ